MLNLNIILENQQRRPIVRRRYRLLKLLKHQPIINHQNRFHHQTDIPKHTEISSRESHHNISPNENHFNRHKGKYIGAGLAVAGLGYIYSKYKKKKKRDEMNNQTYPYHNNFANHY